MKLVLLDRDGVINVDREDSVKSQIEFVLLPGAIPAIKLLNRAGIPVAIVTNQAVVGRGEISKSQLDNIHEYFEMILKQQGAYIDKIYVCTSNDSQNYYRKPNPGLLLKALQDFRIPPEEAIFIGDALRDLEAAKAINCPCILVRTGKGITTLKKGIPHNVLPVKIFNDLYETVCYLLGEELC
jgi:D-glycero-D-manno-heptose 1,7-bisphosphate phosphatase